MSNIFVSPGRYAQGEGALKELGGYIDYYGPKCLVIASNSALTQYIDELKQGLTDKDLIIENFGKKECSREEIERLTVLGKEKNIDFVVGFGGGKPQDVAKAVACKLGYIPVVIIPTIVASDAPTPALSVIYKEDGSFDEYWLYKQNPNIVLVDTGIIAKSPARYLVAGMGDALATKFEADACVQSGHRAVNGGYATSLARSVSDLCYDILIKYGPMAKESNEKNVVTPALEKIVEVNTLLSGLGCENNGCAAAHAIHDGLTILDDVHHYLHGEKVGFCTIVQLVLEGRSPDLIEEIVNFCFQVELPITLNQLGITEDIETKIRKVSESVSDWVHNHPFEVTPKKIFNSIMMADHLGQKFVGC